VGNEQGVGGELVVEGQGGAVGDAFGDGVFVQVALGVVAAEGFEGALAVNGEIHGGATESDEGGAGQASHQVGAEIATGGAVRFIDQHVDVGAPVEIRRHVAELVDHRHDDAAVVGGEQLVEAGDTAGVLHIPQAQGGEVFEHLIFQLIAVDHQQHGGLIGGGQAKEQFGGLDHRVGFATALGVPDQATGADGAESAFEHGLHGGGLMLAEDVLVEFFVFLGKHDVVLQKGQQLGDGAEALDFGLQVADLVVLPGEEVAAHGVPAHAIGEADGIGGGEELLADEQLGRFLVVAADLIDAEGDSFLLISVLAFDHQHGDAIDQKDNVFPGAVVAVMEGPLFGHFVDIARGVVVIDQDQVAFALFGLVHEGAAVAQQLHKIAIAVDGGLIPAQAAQQGTGFVAVGGIEFANLGSQKFGEVEAAAVGWIGDRAGGSKATALFGLGPGHHAPAHRLGIGEDSGLDGFVLAGAGHQRIPMRRESWGGHAARAQPLSYGFSPQIALQDQCKRILNSLFKIWRCQTSCLAKTRLFRNSGAKSAPLGQQTVRSSGLRKACLNCSGSRSGSNIGPVSSAARLTSPWVPSSN
jgi:hypothetical protein